MPRIITYDQAFMTYFLLLHKQEQVVYNYKDASEDYISTV